MSFQSMQSMTPVLWQMLRDIPGGPVAFLNGLWSRLVGAPLCYKTEPVALSGKTLVVSVNNLPWQRTLEKMSDLLIRRINDMCGCPWVEEIRFQLAPVAHGPHLPERKLRAAQDMPAASVAEWQGAGRDLACAEIEEAISSMVSRYL